MEAFPSQLIDNCHAAQHAANSCASQQNIAAVGLDISKSLFQIHTVDQKGATVDQRTLSRARLMQYFSKLQPCLIGIECSGMSHFWARELTGLGHDVRLMSPRDVKPYIRRDKTDANDAEGICEAVQRPRMRFIPIKSADTQAAMALHCSRELLVKQRTQLLNMIRSLFAEFGVTFALGSARTSEMLDRAARREIPQLPELSRGLISELAAHLRSLDGLVHWNDEQLRRWHAASELSQRLASIPGIGIVSATALATTVVEPERFRTARHFASWLGLTPFQRSSGNRLRYGRISRRGNAYLRRLLILGTTSIALHARKNPDSAPRYVVELIKRRPLRIVRVAIAHRNARIAWAIMTHGGAYAPRPYNGEQSEQKL